jgi:hypothetical protein
LASPGATVRSGAFTDEHFGRILGGLARGERIAFTSEAWLTLARLGPEYAQAIWDKFGERWIDRVHKFRRDAAVASPASGEALALDRFRRHLSGNIRELRRLAALEELDLPE